MISPLILSCKLSPSRPRVPLEYRPSGLGPNWPIRLLCSNDLMAAYFAHGPEELTRETIVQCHIEIYIQTPAVISKISAKLIFSSYVLHSERAYDCMCVLIKDIGR